MATWVRTIAGTFVVGFLIAGPVALAYHQQAKMRNFRLVREQVLYRSGQMSLDGLKRVVHDYRIKTVVTLRDASPDGSTPDRQEENFCKSQEINFYRIPPKNWWSPTGPAPVEKGVRQFLDIMANPDNYPVLVHCFAGIHRSGAYCAIYRMEHEHWTNNQAIAEVKACGYCNLDEEFDILGYLEQYQPSWKKDQAASCEEAEHRPCPCSCCASKTKAKGKKSSVERRP